MVADQAVDAVVFELPPEIIANVVAQLGFAGTIRDLANASMVGIQWRAAVIEAESVWENYCINQAAVPTQLNLEDGKTWRQRYLGLLITDSTQNIRQYATSIDQLEDSIIVMGRNRDQLKKQLKNLVQNNDSNEEEQLEHALANMQMNETALNLQSSIQNQQTALNSVEIILNEVTGHMHRWTSKRASLMLALSHS